MPFSLIEPGGAIDVIRSQPNTGTRRNAQSASPSLTSAEKEPEPRQQLIRIRPQRHRAGVIGEHVVQELGNCGDLGAPLINKPERRQRVTGLLHPAVPGHLKRPHVPDRRAVLWHPYLREPPYFGDT